MWLCNAMKLTYIYNCFGPNLGRWWYSEVWSSILDKNKYLKKDYYVRGSALLHLILWCYNAFILASVPLMNSRGLRVNQDAYFSLLLHSKHILLLRCFFSFLGHDHAQDGAIPNFLPDSKSSLIGLSNEVLNIFYC